MTQTTPTRNAPERAHTATIFRGEDTPARNSFAGDGQPDKEGDTLEDAARDSKDYARRRLREELGREPTAEEINEWLRDHTESY